MIFGLIIEILQPVVTRTRSGEIYDELFNLAGILLAIFLWYLIMSLGTNSKIIFSAPDLFFARSFIDVFLNSSVISSLILANSL